MDALKRSLQDVRTLSGKVDRSSTPYKMHMKLCCLEMEKFRKGKERDSALSRVKNIDSRFQEIEAEKVVLLKTLGEQKNGNPAAQPPFTQEPSQTQRAGGFRLRY